MERLERLESSGRSYCCSFPAVFTGEQNLCLFDEHGRYFIDVFTAAGALSDRYELPELRRALLEYLVADGVVHGLDVGRAARSAFLEELQALVLDPRALRYKVRFASLPGTQSVEAALELARQVTGRRRVVSFASQAPDEDALENLESSLFDHARGELPAAVVIGRARVDAGTKVLSQRWLRQLRSWTQCHGIVLVVDETHLAFEREVPGLSFQRSGIEPDIVCLSGPVGRDGSAIAVALYVPELECRQPGEHRSAARDHAAGSIAAAAALRFWQEEDLSRRAVAIDGRIDMKLARLIARHHGRIALSGCGLYRGLVVGNGVARQAARYAFECGLLLRTAGADDEVLKVLPPLTISDADLDAGLDIIEGCVDRALAQAATDVQAANDGSNAAFGRTEADEPTPPDNSVNVQTDS